MTNANEPTQAERAAAWENGREERGVNSFYEDLDHATAVRKLQAMLDPEESEKP